MQNCSSEKIEKKDLTNLGLYIKVGNNIKKKEEKGENEEKEMDVL